MRIASWVMLAALLPAAAQAQVLSRNPAPAPFSPAFSTLSLCVLQPGSITQSDDCSIVPNNSIACVLPDSGGVSRDNRYLRRFLLSSDHVLSDPYTVTSVDFGVQFTEPDSDIGSPITVSTYRIPVGAALTFGNMTILESVTFQLSDAADGTIVNAAVGGTVDPATHDLVVEVRTPDFVADGAGEGRFWIGSNDLGQSRPSYLAAPDCGLSQPTDLATIGFADMHMVMVVNGALEVPVDVKPGENPNCVQPKSNGFVAVAVISTETLDAAEIDPATVEFGGASPAMWALEDVKTEGPVQVWNPPDGYPDLVLKFATQELALPREGTNYGEVSLTGELQDGTAIFGSDYISLPGEENCDEGLPTPPPSP